MQEKTMDPMYYETITKLENAGTDPEYVNGWASGDIWKPYTVAKYISPVCCIMSKEKGMTNTQISASIPLINGCVAARTVAELQNDSGKSQDYQ